VSDTVLRVLNLEGFLKARMRAYHALHLFESDAGLVSVNGCRHDLRAGNAFWSEVQQRKGSAKRRLPVAAWYERKNSLNASRAVRHGIPIYLPNDPLNPRV
jgi:hypothetical protein